MSYEAIVFDKDGTLFDFAATWEAWARSFLLRITNDDHDHAGHLGHQIGFDFARERFFADSVVIAGTPSEVASILGEHVPHIPQARLVDVLNEEAAAAPQAEAVPLQALLQDLRELGLTLGVATNDAEAPARAHLAQAGVTDHFAFIAGCDSGHGAKPGPGQLHAFCQSTGVAPERSVMVGDSTHDLFAGRAAGMATVAVLTGMADTDDLAPYADAVLPDIGHLPAWLKKGSTPFDERIKTGDMS